MKKTLQFRSKITTFCSKCIKIRSWPFIRVTSPSVMTSQLHRLFKISFRPRENKTPKLHLIGPYEGIHWWLLNFSEKMANNVENISTSWRHHVLNVRFPDWWRCWRKFHSTGIPTRSSTLYSFRKPVTYREPRRHLEVWYFCDLVGM